MIVTLFDDTVIEDVRAVSFGFRGKETYIHKTGYPPENYPTEHIKSVINDISELETIDRLIEES